MGIKPKIKIRVWSSLHDHKTRDGQPDRKREGKRKTEERERWNEENQEGLFTM
jgi:hypothetical protein